MSASALKSNITQLCTFLFTFTFFCLFCKEDIRYIKKPAQTYERNSQEKETSMGCVRETPLVNQHWACKRNSPYKPAWGHARGAPRIYQHRVCKTKINSPCKAAWDCKRNSQQKKISHHGVCKRKLSLKGNQHRAQELFFEFQSLKSSFKTSVLLQLLSTTFYVCPSCFSISIDDVTVHEDVCACVCG